MSGWLGPVGAWWISAVTLCGAGVGAAIAQWVTPGRPAITIAVGVVAAVVVAALRVAFVRPDRAMSTMRTKEELVELAESSRDGGVLEARSAELVSRSARFRETTAADVLTPRTSIVSLSATATGAELAAISQSTGFSRVPVYDTDLDDVVGTVHVKSLLSYDADRRASVPLSELVTDVLVVPETSLLPDLLAEMRARATTLAVVLDEYGGTAGIVTIEDLVEELVGEIDDEHDRRSRHRHVVRLAGTVILPGRLNLSEVADAIGIDLPDEGGYETLAGFVMDRLARVPDVGDRFDFEGVGFDVLEMDGHRVATVRVSQPEVVAEDEP